VFRWNHSEPDDDEREKRGSSDPHPRLPARHLRFERQWLVNLILWGNFARLRDEALAALGEALSGKTLQVACVYGDLTPKLLAAHSTAGQLDIIDILPAQVSNLKDKLGATAPRVGIHLGNSAAMPYESASYDRALLFFLLHEQPEDVRRKTLAEALRVVRPGGRLVIVDYQRPRWFHPLYLPMRGILATLEPFALDLWDREIIDWLPAGVQVQAISKRSFFGGLYQLVEVSR
jgi:ubiquinone/menaquinone biosynthesis C-methylase UbiE